MAHTLLPYDDLKLSALALTDELLKQQIRDCVYFLNVIHEIEGDARDFNDRTVKAWRGCELQLCEFGLTCVETLMHRAEPLKLDDEMALLWVKLEFHLDLAGDGDLVKPKWFGDERVHLEYQGLLRYLDSDHYDRVFPNVATCEPERFRYPLEIITV